MSFVWRPGIKCICVDDFADVATLKGEVMPLMGTIYTVRDVTWVSNPSPHPGLYIRLEEIRNKPIFYPGDEEVLECHFDALAFRPLVSRGTDISIFTAMLDKKPTPRERRRVRKEMERA